MKIWDLISEFGNQKLWFGVILSAWLLFEDKITGDNFAVIAAVAIGGMAIVDAVRAWTGNQLENWRADSSDVGVLPPPPESQK